MLVLGTQSIYFICKTILESLAGVLEYTIHCRRNIHIEKHRDPSSALFISILSLKNNSKWSKLSCMVYMHMLTYWWAVGVITCGPTCGHINWYYEWYMLPKGNTHPKSLCKHKAKEFA